MSATRNVDNAQTDQLPKQKRSPQEKGASTRSIDVHRILLENAPKGKPGPKPKNGKELRVSIPPLLPCGKSRSKSAIVLEVRLAHEKPRYYDAWRNGGYKSVTAAATAAGLLKDDANPRRAKSGWRKMTLAQRKEFREWIGPDHLQTAKSRNRGRGCLMAIFGKVF